MARSDTSSTLSAQSQRISEVDESLERIQSREYESQRALDEKPDPYLVLFSENDPDNPQVRGPHADCVQTDGRLGQNWFKVKKWYLTTASGLLVLNATFASSARKRITSAYRTHA